MNLLQTVKNLFPAEDTPTRLTLAILGVSYGALAVSPLAYGLVQLVQKIS